MLKLYEEPLIEEVHDPLLKARKIRLFIKREDLIHPYVSGNKWRKLKYNLVKAKEEGFSTLLTFGGAYSNHIYATAAAACETRFRAIGIIRGEEHLPLNHTLTFASQKGMLLDYMDRSTYGHKDNESVIDNLHKKYGPFYLIPEGGTNNYAIQGAREIVDEHVRKFNFVCTPVGTGGTIAGIILGMGNQGEVLGFSALKGDFIKHEVQNLLTSQKVNDFNKWSVNTEYHFGGYAKIKPELISFINEFYTRHGIPLDPIYTGKMIYGLYDLIDKGYFKSGSDILAIHTGGLQGMKGMQDQFVFTSPS